MKIIITGAAGFVGSSISCCKQTLQINKIINSVAETRGFDIPLYITDNRQALQHWNWQPSFTAEQIMGQIIEYGKKNLPMLRDIRK